MAVIRLLSAMAMMCVADVASAQCSLVTVFDATQAIKGGSIALRISPFEFSWDGTDFRIVDPKEVLQVQDDRVRAIKTAFSEVFNEVMSKAPGSPDRVGAPSVADPQFLLHATLTGLELGNRVARALVGGGQARAAVQAVLTTRDDRPIAQMSCEQATAGGLFGYGGWIALWQSGESLIRKDLLKISQSLMKELGRIAETSQRFAARRRDKADVGELHDTSRVWLDRPPERWSLKDSTSVLAAFMTRTSSAKALGGPLFPMKGVHTLWLSLPAYQALRRSSELLSKGDNSVWLHPFSLLFGDAEFEVGETEPVYAFAVLPFDDAPLYWNPSAIMASTFLRRAGQTDERIRPVALLGPPWPPAVFLFPRVGADGAPLVTAMDGTLELHTMINGRQILSRFDLSRFGLRDVNELGIQLAAGTTARQE